MSGQQSQRLRRNVSPGAATKQGPLRATVPLSLMHQTCSPTRCLNQNGSPSNSPPVNRQHDNPKVKTRNSPDQRISPESQPATSSEKTKPTTKSISSAPFIRRTASVDTIYLLGQWQRDALYLSYCGRLMMDRATQTPEEFEDVDRKSQKKNISASNETLEMKFIRQRLQRTNYSGRGTGPATTLQRHSPVHGDHFAISSASEGNTSPVLPSNAATSPYHHLASCNVNVTPASPTVSGGNNVSATYSSFNSASSCSRAVPIPIPDIPKPLIPRMRSSVEGLNQEIQRLVLKEISSTEGDHPDRTLDPTPEGHRAPIADLFYTTQTVDTQTPFSREDSCHSSNSPASRSRSISPTVPIIPGQIDGSRPSSTEETQDLGSPIGKGLNEYASSPHINKFLAREPPDGCEKVKIAEESSRNSNCTGESQEYGCPKPSVSFVLLPSQSSAFYPLCKNCVMSTADNTTNDHATASSHALSNERLQ